MKNEIIPFGKYKGQPVEVLSQDKPYLEWLQNQDWFKTRYGNINTLIINNFGSPAETPDHNKIQAMFTGRKFLNKFLSFILSDRISSVSKRKFPLVFEASDINPVTSTERIVKPIQQDKNKVTGLENIRAMYKDSTVSYVDVKKAIQKREDKLSFPNLLTADADGVMFEFKGVDVCINYVFCPNDSSFQEVTSNQQIFIEIKPTLSDDYPGVLRQMMANNSQYLLTKEYTGEGATLDQVRIIFGSSGKTIILINEII